MSARRPTMPDDDAMDAPKPDASHTRDQRPRDADGVNANSDADAVGYDASDADPNAATAGNDGGKHGGNDVDSDGATDGTAGAAPPNRVGVWFVFGVMGFLALASVAFAVVIIATTDQRALLEEAAKRGDTAAIADLTRMEPYDVPRFVDQLDAEKWQTRAAAQAVLIGWWSELDAEQRAAVTAVPIEGLVQDGSGNVEAKKFSVRLSGFPHGTTVLPGDLSLIIDDETVPIEMSEPFEPTDRRSGLMVVICYGDDTTVAEGVAKAVHRLGPGRHNVAAEGVARVTAAPESTIDYAALPFEFKIPE